MAIGDRYEATVRALADFQSADSDAKKTDSTHRVFLVVRKDAQGNTYLDTVKPNDRLGFVDRFCRYFRIGRFSLKNICQVVNTVLAQKELPPGCTHKLVKQQFVASLDYLQTKMQKHTRLKIDEAALNALRGPPIVIVREKRALPPGPAAPLPVGRGLQNPPGAFRCYLNASLAALASLTTLKDRLETRKRALEAHIRTVSGQTALIPEDATSLKGHLTELHQQELRDSLNGAEFQRAYREEIALLDATLALFQAINGNRVDGALPQEEGVVKTLTDTLQSIIEKKGHVDFSFAPQTEQMAQEHDPQELCSFLLENLLPQGLFQVEERKQTVTPVPEGIALPTLNSRTISSDRMLRLTFAEEPIGHDSIQSLFTGRVHHELVPREALPGLPSLPLKQNKRDKLQVVTDARGQAQEAYTDRFEAIEGPAAEGDVYTDVQSALILRGSPPSLLPIHLCRFAQVEAGGQPAFFKQDAQVALPRELQVPVLGEGESEPHRELYTLRSVIAHTDGATVHAGHYKAYVAAGSSYREHDDGNVSSVAMAMSKPLLEQNAYLAFYERVEK